MHTVPQVMGSLGDCLPPCACDAVAMLGRFVVTFLMALLSMRRSLPSVHNPTSRLADNRVRWVSSPVFKRYYQEAKTAFVHLLDSVSLVARYLGWLP
jgi:hypothetical protein